MWNEVGRLRMVNGLENETSFTPFLKALSWNWLGDSFNNYEKCVRFEVFTAVTMKNAVFWNIKTQFVPHRKQYIPATDPSRIILCKICGFHGGDYEECRLLEYKTQFVPHRKHYVSATEPSRLMLCKICIFHGGDYEEGRLLEYKTQFVPHRRHYASATEPSRLMLCKI
jgi:hypothetical protein